MAMSSDIIYIFNIRRVETSSTLPLPPPSPLDHTNIQHEADNSGMELKRSNNILFQRTQKIFEKTDAKKYFEPVILVLTEGLLMEKHSPSKDSFRYLGNFLLEDETTNPTMNIDVYISGLFVENLEIKDESTNKEKNGTVNEDEIKVVLDKTSQTILNNDILALNELTPTKPLNYLGEYILKKVVVPEQERGDPRICRNCPWNVKTFNSFEYLKNPEHYDQSLSDPTGPWVTVPKTYREALEDFSSVFFPY